jgi:hypothetical protein
VSAICASIASRAAETQALRASFQRSGGGGSRSCQHPIARRQTAGETCSGSSGVYNDICVHKFYQRKIRIIGKRVILNRVQIACICLVGLSQRDVCVSGEIVHLGANVIICCQVEDLIVNSQCSSVIAEGKSGLGDLDAQRQAIVQAGSVKSGFVGVHRIGVVLYFV